MTDTTWTTKDGITIEISEMETSHIRNCISMLERNWDKLEDADEYIVADHWSLPSIAFIPGKEYFKPKLEALKAELSKRNTNPKMSAELSKPVEPTKKRDVDFETSYETPGGV